jgi:uncharacterized membrane protein (DUF2068 family)
MQFIRETHSQQKTRYDSITMVMLEFFEMIAFIGLLFCLLALTHGVVGFAQEGLLLYTVWFAVATVGTYAMKRGDPWGAYCILLATIVVTVFDILTGKANIGGASLGVLVLVVVGIYLRTEPLRLEDDA